MMLRSASTLRQRIERREARVAVVGQGYVGLSLASAAACAGFVVTGTDVDQTRIDSLSRGELRTPGVDPDLFHRAFRSGRLSFSTEAEPLGEADIVCICVPTPVHDRAPDLSYIERASKTVAGRIRPGSLVVLESTTFPGTTRDVVRPSLETSGLVAGEDFFLAYSPERIDPGNQRFGFQDVPRIVGGLTTASAEVATAFYQQLVDDVVTVTSCQTAELAKLLENTFRQVNIALVNEMAMLCHELGIDVWEAIEAAASKPFGFMAFHPGPGVGGHCIPVDPTYLAWLVRRDVGYGFRLVEEAQDVNAQMPAYVVTRIGEALSEHGKPLRGMDVLVLGVAYKPDVGDVRESPAVAVMSQLRRRGARVRYHDPLVPSVLVDDTSYTSRPLTTEELASADCVALLTPHVTFDLAWIAEHAALVFDARNAYVTTAPANVVRL